MAEETEKQRVDRELNELTNELRIALPGVQVLFAFLLTIPFASGFPDTSRLERHVFFIALATTALATILLVAPSVHHRILFRHAGKKRILEHANTLATAGFAALAASLLASLFLVTDYVFDTETAAFVTGVTAVVVFAFWYAVPIWIHARPPA